MQVGDAAGDGNPAPARIGDAYTKAAVLHGAGDACFRISFHNGPYCFQSFHKGSGIVGNLAVGQHLARTDGV